MYEKAKNYTLLRPRLKKTVGVFLILLGFIGIIVPVMPGAIFVFLGLEFLGLRFLFIDRLLKREVKKVATPEQLVV